MLQKILSLGLFCMIFFSYRNWILIYILSFFERFRSNQVCTWAVGFIYFPLFQTYHQVIDEIYYKVDHLEPWERGSRKTSGQTGMCGGVRGVGAGGMSTQWVTKHNIWKINHLTNFWKTRILAKNPLQTGSITLHLLKSEKNPACFTPSSNLTSL